MERSPIDFKVLIPVAVISLGLLALMLVAWCKIFKKAGLHPGKVFIPVYGQYLMYQIADSGGIFVVVMVLSGVSSLISACTGAASGGTNMSSLTSSIILAILSIVMLILSFIYAVRFARNFGKGIGFAIGLFLLSPVFLCILAFGDAEYIYNKKAKRKTATIRTMTSMPQTGYYQQRPQSVAPNSMPKPAAQPEPVDIRQAESIAYSKLASASAQSPLAEHLQYALKYTTNSGMRGYLERIAKNCTEGDRQKLYSVLSVQDSQLRDAVFELLKNEI